MRKEPQRVANLRERAQYFLNEIKAVGIDTGFSRGFAIIPAIMRSSLKVAKLSNKFFERGINVQPIIYPAVEEKAARLRFFLSNMHTEMQIKQTVETIKELA
jgi:8-amino-7-oxononanoate synthase